MQKESIIALTIVAIVATVGLSMVFSGGSLDSSVTGQAMYATTTKTASIAAPTEYIATATRTESTEAPAEYAAVTEISKSAPAPVIATTTKSVSIPDVVPSRYPVWVPASGARTQTGNEICRGAGFGACVMSEKITYRNYYSSTDGSCSFGRLELFDRESIISPCNAEAEWLNHRCVQWTASEYVPPMKNDVNEYMRINGALCW